MAEKPVLVTTAHRGVFFGYLDPTYKPGDAVVHLAKARNVIFWPADNQGFLGLAAMGPKPGARIGPRAALIELRDVTCVAVCGDAATAAFEAAKWSR